MAVVDSGASETLVTDANASLHECVIDNNKDSYIITDAHGNESKTTTVAKLGGADVVVDHRLLQPLVAVNTLLDKGNDVIFSKTGSYIRHVDTGEIRQMQRNDDTRLWEMSLKDFEIATSPHCSTVRNSQATVCEVSTRVVTFLERCDRYIDCNGQDVERVTSDYDKRLLKVLIKIHTIMGHAAVGNIYTAIKEGLWINTGLQAEDVRRLWSTYQCVACIMAKTNAIPVSVPSDPRTIVPGHTISADPVPVTQPGPNGEKWIFFFKDVATRCWRVRLGKRKSEFPIHLLELILWLAQYGHQVRVLRTDDEAVLQSAEVVEILKDHGNIAAQFSVPYQHHQNTVERDVQTLIKDVSALLYGQYILKQWMWTYAVRWIEHTENATPNSITGKDSPIHMITGEVVNFANTNAFVFGEIVAVGIRKEARVWKFDTKREIGVYLGQPDGYVDGHLIFFPYDQSVLVRGDVMSLRILDEQMAQFYMTRWRMTQQKLAYKDMIEIVDQLDIGRDGEILDRPEGTTYKVQPRVKMPTRSRPQQDIPAENIVVETGAPDTGAPEPESQIPIQTLESVKADLESRSMGNFEDEEPWWRHESAGAAKIRGPDNPTPTAALKDDEDGTWKEAICSECHKNMLGTGTLQKISKVPDGAYTSYLTMQMKRKRLNVKKGRCCYRGDLLPKGLNETYSPTISVLVYSYIRNVAVIDEKDQTLVDTVAAFLAQEYPDDAPILCVRFDKQIAEVAGLDPLQWYRVRKYIYGIPDAGRAYFLAYSSLLIRKGYNQSEFDPCLFYRLTLDGPIWIWIHVDDTYVCTNNAFQTREFVQAVQSQYEVTVTDNIDSYIGIDYTPLPDGSVKLDQLKLLDDTCRSYGIEDCPSVKTPVAYPSAVPPNETLFNVTIYLSLLGVLLWMLHTRPEVGFAVSWGATKAAQPKMCDWTALIRVLQYLHQTRDKGLIIVKQPRGCPLQIYIYCDASHLLYADSKAQTGYGFSINNRGFFYSKSQKQPGVTTSTTHSEMRSLFEAVCRYIYLHHVAAEIGRPLVDPAIVLEDNMPVVTLLTRERSLPQASKHFVMLVNWGREQVAEGKIDPRFLGTELMTPDILTKSVFGQDFQYKAQQLRGLHPGEEELQPVPSKRSKKEPADIDMAVDP